MVNDNQNTNVNEGDSYDKLSRARDDMDVAIPVAIYRNTTFLLCGL